MLSPRTLIGRVHPFAVLNKARFSIPLILLLGFLAYGNALTSPFYFDDTPNIIQNERLRDLHNFWPPRGMRYIGDLTFALNYRAGGLDPFGYHVVNVLFHLMNGVLMYALVRLTFRTPFLAPDAKSEGIGDPGTVAFFSGLIFVLHPLQTQAVTYIVQRYASLATFFCLLALVLYIRSRLFPNVIIYVCAVLSALFAIKTKETAFTLPLLVAVYDALFLEAGWRKRLLYLSPFFLAALIIPLNRIDLSSSVSAVIAQVGQATRADAEEFGFSRTDYMLTQPGVLMTYLRLFFFPVNQALEYDYPVYHALSDGGVFIALIMLSTLFIASLYFVCLSRRRTSRDRSRIRLLRLPAFGILWFFIALSVESTIIPIAHLIFEHRAYYASPGLVLALVSAAVLVTQDRMSAAKIFLPAALIVSLFFGILTHERNALWGDAIAFWQDGAQKTPRRVAPYYYLGEAYRSAGRFREALDQFKMAAFLGEGYAEIHLKIGQSYEGLGWLDDAAAAYETAIGMNKNYVEAYVCLGNVYLGQGMEEKALQQYRAALSIRPFDERIRAAVSRILALKEKGRQ